MVKLSEVAIVWSPRRLSELMNRWISDRSALTLAAAKVASLCVSDQERDQRLAPWDEMIRTFDRVWWADQGIEID